MAPADDSHAGRVEERIPLQHSIARAEHVVIFPAAVVDRLGIFGAVAGAAPVIGRDHDVALLIISRTMLAAFAGPPVMCLLWMPPWTSTISGTFCVRSRFLGM